MIKKGITIVLIITLVFAIISCGSKKEEDTTLRVYGLYTNLEVNEFIYNYKNINPEVYIVIENGVSINGTDDIKDSYASEALKKLNTRLLAGEGPDIIIMDDIKAEKYIEQGLFKDISSIVNKSEGISKGIIESNKHDGKIYCMPAAISLITDAVRTGKEVDFSSAKAYLESMKTQGLDSTASYDNLAALFYRLEIDPLIKKKGGISREKLKEFYIALDELEDYTEGGSGQASFWHLNMAINPLMIFRGIANGEETFPDRTLKNVDVSRDYITWIKGLQGLYGYEHSGVLDFSYQQMDGEYIYIPMIDIAINANTKNIKLAEDFVRYAFSKEGQEAIRAALLFPVNVNVTAEEIRKKEKDYYNNELVPAFKDEDIDEILGIIENLNTPLVADGNLMEIIMFGAADYVNGKASIDDALDTALNKLEIYLSE